MNNQKTVELGIILMSSTIAGLGTYLMYQLWINANLREGVSIFIDHQNKQIALVNEVMGAMDEQIPGGFDWPQELADKVQTYELFKDNGIF